MKWISYKDQWPQEDDYPLWRYDEELDALSFIKCPCSAGIMPRQDSIKEETLWTSAEFEVPEFD